MPIAQINGHDMYYEVHGDGPPAVYIGGWDTFCHGRDHYLARGMTEQFSTVIIDYRGLGESTDDYSMEPFNAVVCRRHYWAVGSPQHEVGVFRGIGRHWCVHRSVGGG
jgi:pimeloyl-ACP methyl ester carboxylesterase